MTNEQFIRSAYHAAEIKDIPGWVACFAPDGTFTDESLGVTYRGNELGRPVEVYAKAFPDMHRELYEIIVQGDVVIVELSLNGTQRGPLGIAERGRSPFRKKNESAVLRCISPE